MRRKPGRNQPISSAVTDGSSAWFDLLSRPFDGHWVPLSSDDAEKPKRRRKRKQDGESQAPASKAKKRRSSPCPEPEVSRRKPLRSTTSRPVHKEPGFSPDRVDLSAAGLRERRTSRLAQRQPGWYEEGRTEEGVCLPGRSEPGESSAASS